MMKYSSPYPGVRSVAEIKEDDVPIETFRAYFLGVGWAVIGTFMSTFFNSRFPGIGNYVLTLVCLSESRLASMLTASRLERLRHPDPAVSLWQVPRVHSP